MIAVVALLGWTMFFGWAKQRSARVGAPDAGSATPGAELRFPIPAIALHGVAAVTTVVLVFLTAIDFGA